MPAIFINRQPEWTAARGSSPARREESAGEGAGGGWGGGGGSGRKGRGWPRGAASRSRTPGQRGKVGGSTRCSARAIVRSRGGGGPRPARRQGRGVTRRKQLEGSLPG